MPTPTSTKDNEVLLKLAIKGFDPGEAARIAAASADVLTAEMRAAIARQAELYKTAAETQNAQSRAYAQQEIKEQRAKAQAILDLIKQGESEQLAAKKAADSAQRAADKQALQELAAIERARSQAVASEARDRANSEKAALRESEAINRAHAAAIAEDNRRMSSQIKEEIRAQEAAEKAARAAKRSDVKAAFSEAAQIEKAHASAMLEDERRTADQTVNLIRNERREIKEALSASQAALLQARRAYRMADTEEARAQAKDEVEAARAAALGAGAALRGLEKEHKASMVGMQTNWRAWLEVGENATTVLTGIFNVVQGGYQRFKAFGDEISRTTQIFQSQHISVEAARIAIDQTATSLQLITAANKAAELELELTGKQFADVARQAKQFADATGTGTVEALDSLVTGLATGKEELLKHAGILIDNVKAEKDFAREAGITADKLDDAGKAYAHQQAALAKLAEKSREAAKEIGALGAKSSDVSHEIERGVATISESWNKFVLSLGTIKVDPALPEFFEKVLGYTNEMIHGMLVEFPHAIRLASAAIQDAIHPFKDEHNRDQENARYGAILEAEKANIKKQADARAKAISDAELKATQSQSEQHAKAIADARRHAAEVEAKKDGDKGKYSILSDYNDMASRRVDDEIKTLFGMIRDAKGEWINVTEGLAEAEIDRMKRTIGVNLELSKEGYQQFLNAQKNMTAASTKTNPLAIHSIDETETDGGTNKDYWKNFVAAQGKALQVAKEQIANNKANKEQLGFLSVMFGDDFLNKSREEMTELERITFDSTSSMKNMFDQAGTSMAMGFGQAAAASLADGKSLKAGLRDTTNEVLKTLSAQAIGFGLMELAQAAAAEAQVLSGNVAMIPSVGAHLVAAAAFGAVGVGAGLAARAVGHSSSSSAGSTPTSTRGSDFTSTPSRGSADNTASAINLSIYVSPGGEAEAGRSIVNALEAYQAQTGKDLSHLVSARA